MKIDGNYGIGHLDEVAILHVLGSFWNTRVEGRQGYSQLLFYVFLITIPLTVGLRPSSNSHFLGLPRLLLFFGSEV